MEDPRSLFQLCFSAAKEAGFVSLFYLHRETGKTLCQQFSCRDLDAAAVHALSFGNKPGVDAYFSPAVLGRELDSSHRGVKDDFIASRVCWVDLDPPVDLEKITQFQPPPTMVVSSGRGYHAYWLLDRLTDPPVVEEINYWLEQQLGGDNCHSIDHLLRIPGTTNTKNNEPVKTLLLERRIYTVEDLGRQPPPKQDLPASLVPEALSTSFLEDLPSSLRERIVDASEDDRSVNDYYVVRTLIEKGYTPGQCLAVLTNPAWAISRKTLQQGVQYAVRTIQAATTHEKTDPDSLQLLIEELHWQPGPKESLRRVKEIDPDHVFTGPVIKWLRDHKLEFLRDQRTGDGYLFWNGRIIRADKDSRDLKDFLYHQAGITEMTWDSRKIREALAHESRVYGKDVVLHPWIVFDTRKCQGYFLLDSRRGEVVVVGPNSLKYVSNGTDGYLLKPSLLATPQEVTFSQEKVNGLTKLNQLLTSKLACPPTAQALMTCYVLAVGLSSFAVNDLLPILHVTGMSGGGKSWALKLLTTWFYGHPILLQSTQASSQAISDSDPFISLDDYETLDAEWQRRLLTGATGQIRTKMSSSGENLVIQQSSACFALTSLTPLLSETLRRRAVVVDVNAATQGSTKFNATTAINNLTEVRSEIWGAYLRLLAEDVLPTMHAGSAQENITSARELMVEPNKGLSTYLTLMWLVGSAIEKYIPGFLGVEDTSLVSVLSSWSQLLELQSEEEFVERESLIQYVETLFDDLNRGNELIIGDTMYGGGPPNGYVVKPVIEKGSLIGFEGSGGELHSTFGALCKNHGLRYEMRNANSVGRRFQLQRSVLASAGWIAEPKKFGPRRGWHVTRKGETS